MANEQDQNRIESTIPDAEKPKAQFPASEGKFFEIHVIVTSRLYNSF
jgi:hypothetical protein